MTASNGSRRDLVVIGGSAGGLGAVSRILSELPRAFPAALCVTLHQLAGRRSALVDVLRASSNLPVSWATDRGPLESGHVHVAPPDIHLLVARGDADGALEARLVPGPKENHSRPSIARTFRSAAANAGGRTIAVLLTGMLYDGVTGLDAVRRSGGLSVAQDPADAEFPDLPRNAVESAVVDLLVRVDALGALLVERTGEAAPASEIPPDVTRQAALDLSGRPDVEGVAALGPQTPVSCPECRGSLWQVDGPAVPIYRCYLGHAASSEAILQNKDREIEQSLWAAVRAMQERAFTLAALAETNGGRNASLGDYAARAAEAREHAERLRGFLLELQLEDAARGRTS